MSQNQRTEPQPKCPGIYLITCLIGGRFYVGSAKSFANRRGSHIAKARAGKHHNPHFQAAWNKYGERRFVFHLLESVADLSALATREQFWMDAMRAAEYGYNVMPVARSSLGRKMSDEAKAKMSAHKKGKPLSAEHRAKMSAAKAGHKLSAEHCEAIRRGLVGHGPSDACRKAVAESNRRRAAAIRAAKAGAA